MGRATLSYYADGQKFVIYSDMLYNIDKYTSEMKNERELFENVPKDEQLSRYLNNNKKKGTFKISYVDRDYYVKTIPVLYNQKPIEVDDRYNEGIVSESELARRNLLNSDEQLYSKLFILNKDIDQSKKYTVIISNKDKEILESNKIFTFKKEGYNAVSIEDLIRFRSSHSKLKEVRPIYEEALDLWKEKMNDLNYEDIYFLSREYRVINNYYNRIRENGLSVNNLEINKKNLDVLKHKIGLDTMSPLMVRRKYKKKKLRYSYQ